MGIRLPQLMSAHWSGKLIWHIFEPFCVYDGCLCITSAWGVPLGLCEVFLLGDLQDGCYWMKDGWRLRCCDLGRCCNYEMAVWEHKGEDTAMWRGSFWMKRTGFWRKRQGSSIEGSCVVLVIFRCVWRSIEPLLQKNWGERQKRNKKPRSFRTSRLWFCWKKRLHLRGCLYSVNKIQELLFFESHQCGSIGQEMCVVSLSCCCVYQSLNH